MATFEIHANPKVELCAFQDDQWIRLSGELVSDERYEAKASMLDAYPSLKRMYSAEDDNTEVFYFRNASYTIASFTAPPVSGSF